MYKSSILVTLSNKYNEICFRNLVLSRGVRDPEFSGRDGITSKSREKKFPENLGTGNEERQVSGCKYSTKNLNVCRYFRPNFAFELLITNK